MKVTAGIVGRGGIGAAVAGLPFSARENLHMLGPADTLDLAPEDEVGALVIEGDEREARDAISRLRSRMHAGTVIASAVEGLNLAQLRALAGPEPVLFRVVPLPTDVPQAGSMFLCAGDAVRPEEFETVRSVLANVGTVALVSEEMLDSSRALARSAFGLLTAALEGIEDGAVAAGLPTDIARAFIRQTLLTTALLLQHQGGSPADLKDQVASPAGTTIAGLAVLEERGVRGAFMRAMEQTVRPRETAGQAARRVVE
jgi:pyrroline-5-carboxylate reductase